MKCCRCHRPLTAAAAWKDPVTIGPGVAVPGALGPVCAVREGLVPAKPTNPRKRAAAVWRNRKRKADAAQLDLLP